MGQSFSDEAKPKTRGLSDILKGNSCITGSSGGSATAGDPPKAAGLDPRTAATSSSRPGIPRALSTDRPTTLPGQTSHVMIAAQQPAHMRESDQVDVTDDARSLTACTSTASLFSSISQTTTSSLHTTPSVGALSNFSASSYSSHALVSHDFHQAQTASSTPAKQAASATNTARTSMATATAAGSLATSAAASRPTDPAAASAVRAALRPAPASVPNKPPTAGRKPRATQPQTTLTLPLHPPVLGLDELQVLVVQLDDVNILHQSWLLQGWELPDSAAVPAAAVAGPSQPKTQSRSQRKQQQGGAAQEQQQGGAAQQQQQPLPKVIGFDTEFIGDQLALVQLCCGGRVLLMRVPPQRNAGLPNGGGSSNTSAQPGGSKAGGGGGSGMGRVGAVERSAGKVQQQPHPFSWPSSALKTQICDPSIFKAAAEVWQDAVMLFAAFGIKLRNGLDLTVACPPSDEEQKRGRKKLSLFSIFESLFPDAQLAKDKTIDHQQWFSAKLSEKQIKYGALDAFVSYAAGVRVLQREQSLPAPVDLSLASHSEVVLAAQWVLTSQFQEASRQKKTQHDFYSARFETHKKGLVLVVQMARFKTRLRRDCWVEVRLPPPDGRRMSGRCVFQRGKTAHVSNLRWSGGGRGREVHRGEVGDQVQGIEMEEVGDTAEGTATKDLLVQVLCGLQSALDGDLLVGLFGGGSLKLKQPEAAAAAARVASEARGRVLAAVTSLQVTSRVNAYQRNAIEAILCGDRAVQLVQGPPGTGKTTVISHTVAMWTQLVAPTAARLGPGRHVEALACVARSNVAAKNIALALLKRGLGPKDFRLVVSEDYHLEWHEEQYRGALQAVLITSAELREDDIGRRLEEVQVFVTTVSMLASPRFRAAALYGKELTRLLVDEASQIYAGDLLLPLHQYGKHLKSLSLFGDDVQLPPFGSEWDGAQLPSLFDHLNPPAHRAAARLRHQPHAFRVGPELTPPRGAQLDGGGGGGAAGGGGTITAAAGGPGDGAHRVMLSVSYRLPPQLCGFISRELYGGALRSGRSPDTPDGRNARLSIRWLDVAGKEEGGGSSSFRNREEAAAVSRLLERDEFRSSSWTVITGYDMQRTLLEKMLANHGAGGGGAGGLPAVAAAGGSGSGDRAGGDRVYNIDTFQGREDEVVIASLVRSGTSLGFMKDDRRVNVMLTRCTRQLVVVGRLALALSHPDTLIGRMAVHCQQEGLVEGTATSTSAGQGQGAALAAAIGRAPAAASRRPPVAGTAAAATETRGGGSRPAAVAVAVAAGPGGGGGRAAAGARAQRPAVVWLEAAGSTTAVAAV